MGFKKGRAARAIANAAASIASQNSNDAAILDSLKIWNDGGSCVGYTACNGSEYKIDVATMEQINLGKGTLRKVHRRKGHDKHWTMWQFEASRSGNRCTRSSISYIQYPKWVGFALEERWRYLQQAPPSSNQSTSQRANLEAWRQVLSKFDKSSLMAIFNTADADASQRKELEIDTCNPCEILGDKGDFDPKHAQIQIRALMGVDATLQSVFFEHIVERNLPPLHLANGIRWLIGFGFQPSAAHCRTVALSCGSVTALRLLIMEADVDVCGLELLESGASAYGKHLVVGNGGWIQHSKHAVKVLLARGALVGGQGSRSKLLKRVESDGDKLWARRLLDAMGTEFPEFVIQQLEAFLCCPPVAFHRIEDAAEDSA